MCLDDQILNTYLDGELAEPWRTQVAEHLNYCPACNARYEQLRILHKVVSSSRLNEEEIAPYQQNVLKFIENNYVNKRKKIGFIHRNFRVSMPIVLTAAAAFVVVLVGAFLFQGPTAGTLGEIIPQVASSLQPGSVVQVRTTEGLASSRLLENYSLEEILQYLDAKGYEVDVRLKGIKPVGTILTQTPFKVTGQTANPVASTDLGQDVIPIEISEDGSE
jgi:predicted anti-sigma-YlaC factor YlaD